MNLFGTDGIRTKFGNYPLTLDNITDLGKSICLWAKTKYAAPRIIIAHDTRLSCSVIKSLINAGLLQYDVDIYDAQILPTPAVYNLVKKQKLFDVGIVITASHNLYQDNGIKIIDSYSDKLTESDEKMISDFCTQKKFITIDYENLGKLTYWTDAQEKYLTYISKFFEPNFAKNTKVILDCANGATSFIAQKIFQQFGAITKVINSSPNGKNINSYCGSTHPEMLENLVVRDQADIGFAFDGDGDRIIVVNKTGQIKDGDDILALLIDHPAYKTDVIVSTIISNFGFEHYLQNKNKKLIRTAVGDKYVAQMLAKENLPIGGEQSGHIILRDYLNSSDSIFTALRVLQTIINSQNWECKTFEKFPQFSVNLPVTTKEDLCKEPFVQIIAEYNNNIAGRVIVRYSGTEPLLRIVVETENINLSKEVATKLSIALNSAFQKNKEIFNDKKAHIQTI